MSVLPFHSVPRDRLSHLPSSPGPYDPIEGTLIPEESTNALQVRWLAQGIATNIFRCTPRDRTVPSYIEKRFDTISKYRKERDAYRILNQLYAQAGPVGSFRSVRATFPLFQMRINLTDVQGVPLQQALNDPRIPITQRQLFLQAYLVALADFDRRMENKFPSMERERWRPTYLGVSAMSYTDGTREVFINVNQVVVSFEPGNPEHFVLKLVDGY